MYGVNHCYRLFQYGKQCWLQWNKSSMATVDCPMGADTHTLQVKWVELGVSSWSTLSQDGLRFKIFYLNRIINGILENQVRRKIFTSFRLPQSFGFRWRKPIPVLYLHGVNKNLWDFTKCYGIIRFFIQKSRWANIANRKGGNKRDMGG